MSMTAFSKDLTNRAAAITTYPIKTTRVTVVALSDNVGTVSVGTAALQPVTLGAGDSIDLYPDEATEVYALSTEASGDAVAGLIYS